jgi:single-strand DNA-binding protein
MVIMNVFIASGNLGKDLDLRVTPNGKSVGSFPLPVKQGYGEYEKVSWVDCKLLGDRADKLAPYLLKGKPVTVQGEFVLETWEKGGIKHSKPVVIVNNLDMHNSGESGANRSPGRRGDQPELAHKASTPTIDAFDDDIPF